MGSTNTIPAPSANPYQDATIWADGWILVPGDRNTKSPLVKFKAFFDRMPDAGEIKHFQLRGSCGAQPLLVLDHPLSDRMALCVVDIDDLCERPAVEAWLGEHGLKVEDGLLVTTGRAGGGLQVYFRREVGKESHYHQHISAKRFKPKAVDLKGWHNYVVSPGAVHQTGRVYTATFRGQPVANLRSVFAQLPILPVAAWEAGDVSLDAPTPETDASGSVKLRIPRNDPNWLQVVLDGRRRQPCPWCNHRDQHVLAFFPEKGAAFCHKEKVWRSLETKPGSDLDRLLETALADARPMALEIPGEHPMEKAEALVDEIERERDAAELAAERANDGFRYPPSFTDVGNTSGRLQKTGSPALVLSLDDLDALETEANDIMGEQPYAVCPSGGSRLFVRKGIARVVRTPCRAHHCEVCGPRVLNADAAASIVVVEDLVKVGDWRALRVSNANLLNLTQAWKAIHLTVAVSPTETESLILWDEATSPPGAVRLRHLLHAGAREIALADLRMNVTDLFLRVDAEAWGTSSKRATVLRGTKALRMKIVALRDLLLGQQKPPEREKVAEPERVPDGESFSVHTHTPPLACIAAIEQIVQTTLVVETTYTGRSRSVEYTARAPDANLSLAGAVGSAIDSGAIKVRAKGFYDLAVNS